MARKLETADTRSPLFSSIWEATHPSKTPHVPAHPAARRGHSSKSWPWSEQCCGKLLTILIRAEMAPILSAHPLFLQSFCLGHSKALRIAEQKDGRTWVLDAHPGPLTPGVSDTGGYILICLSHCYFEWFLYSVEPDLILVEARLQHRLGTF